MLSKLVLLGSAVQAGKCPFGFDNETKSVHHPRVRSSAAYPSEIFPCNGGNGVATSTSTTRDTYKAIVSDVIDKYELTAATVSDNLNPRAKYAGCLVRTAGHDFMDFRYG
jgi:hypothetical protein